MTSRIPGTPIYDSVFSELRGPMIWRGAWIAWCLLCAAFWELADEHMVPGFEVGHQAAKYPGAFFVLSLAAIAIPIGGQRRTRCSVCGNKYRRNNMALHLQVRHGIGPTMRLP